jgi:hypothetical protein
MSLKNTVFFDVIPCSPLEVYLRFGGHYCLHLRGRNVSQTTNQQEVGGK